MYLIFDTETTGFILDKNKPTSQLDNFPRVIQLAWQIHDEKGNLIENHDYIIRPEGFTIPFAATQVHGISTEKAIKEGHNLVEILLNFNEAIEKSILLVGHNIIEYDIKVLAAEYIRNNILSSIEQKKAFDTMSHSKVIDFCALGGGKSGRLKFPKLAELYQKLFQESFDEAHNAAADVNANARSFFELIRQKVVLSTDIYVTQEQFLSFLVHHKSVVKPFPIKIRKQISQHKQTQEETTYNLEISSANTSEEKSNFFHFHVHTTYSILQSTIKIKDLVDKAIACQMPAIGITDYGNLMGAFQFINEVNAKNAGLEQKLIPIVGCEVYVSEQYLQNKFTKDNPDRKYTQVLLAKNHTGFQNLSKISTIGYTKGFYAGNPRVGKEIILQYKENLIATTGSVWSEVPSLIINQGEEKAEEVFLWWKEQFGDDFYIELIDHQLAEEKHINEVLIQFSKKHQVKILAQNEPFYLNPQEANSQDILICIRDGEKLSVPKGRGFGHRFGLKNEEYYFKTASQIRDIFKNQHEAISNFDEFIQKFEPYTLKRNVLLPTFDIPESFKNKEDELDGGHRGENAYLKHLTYKGAEKRYGTISDAIQERLDFELETIENTGYPGYFLIVQDFTSEARKMGVSVGPGRGSAAGSAVAYCIGITNVDPIKYNLLFERFLNPERVSLPDIDIDFDDRGRDKIINWVVEKYGQNQVAQIITYGTLAGRSAIRDTGRVLELPLKDTDALSKRLPATLNLKSIAHSDEKTLKEKVRNDDFEGVKYIKQKSIEQESLEAKVIQNATLIEGGIRNTGVHACGVIITPEDITNLVPVAVAKDSDLWVSQFDNSVVESAGLLKMDFLGLRTLTIIKDAIEIIQERKGISINPDEIPLDNELTYERVFKSGNTVGIFQFESPGMQKNLKLLQPNKFEDLIAMTALYRPGPMEYIPNFINRKHGKEPITFDLPEMQEYLEETYGITVYQEQVMLLSQKLAGFTKGGADSLRKAMGKKKKEEMDKMFTDFVQGGIANGHPKEILQKVWKDWEAFAQYAFNKSHATCYSVVSFHTAYLKAHYPSEFMASLLTNNLGNLKTVTFFMEECKKMNIEVLAPDVNESNYAFFVNKEGNIRFGLGAIKGVGQNAVDCIVNERRKNGKYQSIFDFFERVDLRNVNKKVVESLALSGAFDEIGRLNRSQYFQEIDGNTFVENLLRYGANSQENINTQQQSLFSDSIEGFELQKPKIPVCEEWNILQKLAKEKEMVGMYISSHPLDEYKYEIKKLNPVLLADLESQKERFVDQPIHVIGMIQSCEHRLSTDGRSEFGIFELEDYSGTMNFRIYGEIYLKVKHYIALHQFVCVKVAVKRNIHNPAIVYININGINLLKEVLNTVQNITIALNVDTLNIQEMQNLIQTIEENKGEQTLHFNFLTVEENLNLSMKSMKHKVTINKTLLESLQTIKSIKYKLN